MMKKSSLLFFYCYIGFFSLVFADGAKPIIPMPNDEASILLLMKSSLVDPLNKLQNWKIASETRSVHCNWTGVWCNNGGFVEKLDLSNMNLSGIVSDHIQGLSSLAVLNLCNNGFETALPKIICQSHFIEDH
ncbi:hypothetical protein COLO4_03418 [Corchorus olitorius]|uniref:Leucine-rich repeat-containing N-terminal plant-type domain-containing protein n=1 Tax=Corchorus olitorius TaxID=93759 RepID=A0A1R3KYL5_9ROSI|nr:hypothetical protein COLO4_03418 [Corchorus olitorius]